VPGTSAQGVAGSHSVGIVLGMAEQYPELADGTPVTPSMRAGGIHQLTPQLAVEWLALNASVSRVGEQMGC